MTYASQLITSAAEDLVVDVVVRAGATITFRNLSDNQDGLAALTDLTPADDDPRAPLAFTFPSAPNLQVDVLSIRRYDADADTLVDALLTGAGFPIQSSSPDEAIITTPDPTPTPEPPPSS